MHGISDKVHADALITLGSRPQHGQENLGDGGYQVGLQRLTQERRQGVRADLLQQRHALPGAVAVPGPQRLEGVVVHRGRRRGVASARARRLGRGRAASGGGLHGGLLDRGLEAAHADAARHIGLPLGRLEVGGLGRRGARRRSGRGLLLLLALEWHVLLLGTGPDAHRGKEHEGCLVLYLGDLQVLDHLLHLLDVGTMQVVHNEGARHDVVQVDFLVGAREDPLDAEGLNQVGHLGDVGRARGEGAEKAVVLSVGVPKVRAKRLAHIAVEVVDEDPHPGGAAAGTGGAASSQRGGGSLAGTGRRGP
mmetsp:Transcript_9586/g.21070  ORF Transcript_9586/g.21070 Transcript_9586/m.21070 type:complete len:307 (+) Transcript_9586:456-1376(+)